MTKHQLHYGYDFRTSEFYLRCSCGHQRWAPTFEGIDIAAKQHEIYSSLISTAVERDALRTDSNRS